MIKEIVIPDYLGSIKKNTIGIQKDINVIGCDIETLPFKLLGFYTVKKDGNQHNTKDNDIMIIEDIKSKRNRFKTFLLNVDRLTSSKKTNVIGFHNLRFDLQHLLLHYKDYFLDNDFILYFDRKGNNLTEQIYTKLNKDRINDIIKVHVFCSKTWFIRIYFGSIRGKQKFKKMVIVLDTFAFFRSSLLKLSKYLKLKHKKYIVEFETTSKKDLKKYLINDCKVQYDLIIKIIEFHRLYDVSICISIAQLSAKIFKKNFIMSPITQLPSYFLQPAILSYHGGKNGFYGDRVEKIDNVTEIDVNSMYPYAKTQIPNFSNCSFKFIKEYDDNYNGIYKVSGKLKKCKYPIFYTHDFKPIKKGIELQENIIAEDQDYFYIENLWITSYELKEALRAGEFQIIKCVGIVVIEQDGYNPLKEFVNHFYEKKKNTPEENPEYFFYKIILNSLYGKFIQNIDYKQEFDYVIEKNGEKIIITEIKKVGKAGGLFQPLIASLITGFSRAYMHKLEHKYNSIHTATDSVMTLEKNIKVSDNLGDISIKFKGDIIIFRNKCYIQFGDYIKYAKHGFHGNLKDLMRIYLSKNKEYSYSRFTNIRESLKRVDKKLIPCEWNEFESVLNVKW